MIAVINVADLFHSIPCNLGHILPGTCYWNKNMSLTNRMMWHGMN